MNAHNREFVKRLSDLSAKVLASMAGCALLGACVGNPFADAKVDPRSPIAKEVAATVRRDASYPTFASVPPAPKDVRPRRQYGQAAVQVERSGTQLVQATADDQWTLQNTETFASDAQKAAGPDMPTTAQQADTEAFAAALRKRATPPPPAKH